MIMPIKPNAQSCDRGSVPSFTLEPSDVTGGSLPDRLKLGREDSVGEGLEEEDCVVTRSSSVPLSTATRGHGVKVVSDTCSYGAESRVIHRPKGGHLSRIIMPSQRGGDRSTVISPPREFRKTVKLMSPPGSVKASAITGAVLTEAAAPQIPDYGKGNVRYIDGHGGPNFKIVTSPSPISPPASPPISPTHFVSRRALDLRLGRKLEAPLNRGSAMLPGLGCSLQVLSQPSSMDRRKLKAHH